MDDNLPYSCSTYSDIHGIHDPTGTKADATSELHAQSSYLVSWVWDESGATKTELLREGTAAAFPILNRGQDTAMHDAKYTLHAR